MTTSYIRLEVEGKVVTVNGEAAGIGPDQQPYFVAYADSFSHCDPPNQDVQIDDNMRQRLLQILVEDCRARNFPLEIE
jgi:hypothetical protein